jgi:Alcohol dehydrogenase GroES-like domain
VVRVVAAGVNFLDVGQRRGTYPRQVPFTLGVEGAGMVESAGEGVRNVKPSDRVAFTGMPSAYSEAILADADRLIPLPNEFTFQEGAAFPRQLGSEPVFGRALCDLISSDDWYGIVPFRLGYPTRLALASPRRSVQEVLL